MSLVLAFDSVTAGEVARAFDNLGTPMAQRIGMGYVDGIYANVGEMASLMPGATIVGIAVHSGTNAGHMGDCESGDMTIGGLIAWVIMRRASGESNPIGYLSLAVWADARAAFAQAGVPEPQWEIAAYPGIGAMLYTGACAHQFADVGPHGENVDQVILDPALFFGAGYGSPAQPQEEDVKGVVLADPRTGAWWFCREGVKSWVNDAVIADYLFATGQSGNNKSNVPVVPAVTIFDQYVTVGINPFPGIYKV